MNPRAVTHVVATILLALGIAMLAPAVLAWLEDEADLEALLLAAAVALGVGLLLWLRSRGDVDLHLRDGFVIVTVGWLAASLVGALPYLWTGVTESFPDAFFESVSGFTTTGASIFTNVETLPRGLLLWRSLTQWLGGMGIVVLSVAILPALSVGGMQLFKAEVPGGGADRLSPRIQSTAKILWGVYAGMSALEVALLVLCGMDLFEAVCHTFTTVSTGGFSTRNASIGAFDSAAIDAVVIVFMYLAGANFALHYWLLRGRLRHYWANEEYRLYTALTVGVIFVLWAIVALQTDTGVWLALRQAAFQTCSILTSTGFATADYLLWGALAQLLLFAAMFVGGCTGSTGGGLKVMRALVLTRVGMRELRKQLHPQAIFNVRLSGKLVPEDVVLKILGFFMFYVSIFLLVALGVAATGVEPMTAFGASIASLSNIGPGFGQVGPASNYAGLPAVAKLLLSGAMLLGRLELFTVLVLFLPMFWRRG